MKRRVITISGNIASGKSEVAKLLAEKLSFELYKASEMFRRQARDKNMTLVEFNEYLKSVPELDMYVDKCTSEYANGKENIVIDARLGFHFVEDAFDVFLNVDIDEAARRLFAAAPSRGKEEDYKTLEEAKNSIMLREQAEKTRYIARYSLDVTNLKNYTCVIDTTNITSKEVVEKIIEQYNEWLKD